MVNLQGRVASAVALQARRVKGSARSFLEPIFEATEELLGLPPACGVHLRPSLKQSPLRKQTKPAAYDSLVKSWGLDPLSKLGTAAPLYTVYILPTAE